MRRIAGIVGTAALFGAVGPALAHDEHAPLLEEVVTYGRAEQQLGVATSASEGLVGYDDIALPPLLRTGELAEAVPGLVATQHSGTGKANQFFLRGFNLDHGTDFSASAEGVPLNMRSHGHGQGYLDLNFLIPELVETTRYRKGPYAAEVGDFSSAGAVRFDFYDRLDESFAELAVGENGFNRALLGASADIGESALLGALDLTRYDGPWQLPEDLVQNKAYLSFVTPVRGGRAKITAQAYSNDWDSTDQVPLRAVETGLIDERGFIDPDLGGETDRFALTGALVFDRFQLSAYAIDYDFTLFSNFTYRLDDPDNGDEFEQRDSRQIFGASLAGNREGSVFGQLFDWHWGVSGRFDDIDEVALYRTTARQRNETLRRDAVDEASVSAWTEVRWSPTDRLRTVIGIRADTYDWDVSALRSVNSGSGDDQQVSPKLTVAYRFTDTIEGYLNYGRGMHSNDVRGTTIRIDPSNGQPVDPVDALVASDGAEVGLRYEKGPVFNATLTAFWLQLDSELVYVGDAGTTEPNDGSRRTGIEANMFWQARDWVAVNASYTYADSRFDNAPGNFDDIPGAIRESASVGAIAAFDNGFGASLRLRYLGKAPLVEDGSVSAPDSLLVNAGAAWRSGAFEWRLDIFNLLDSDDYDIAYFYASRLAGEAPEGVDDIHFHPVEPRTMRASVSFYW